MSRYIVVLEIESDSDMETVRDVITSNIEGIKDTQIRKIQRPKTEIEKIPCLYQG